MLLSPRRVLRERGVCFGSAWRERNRMLLSMFPRICPLLLLLPFLFAAVSSPPAVAQGTQIVLPKGFQQTLFASGLSLPTKMVFSPDGRLFVSEKAGRLKVLDANGQLLGTFLDLTGSVETSGSRGLFGIAFDPGFLTNGYVFIYYTSNDTGFNRISRFTASQGDPNEAEPGSELVM